MTCLMCKHGEAHPGRVTVTLERGSATIIIKGVPGEVCENCGEAYFEAETVKELDRLRTAPPMAERIVEVPVYSFGRQP